MMRSAHGPRLLALVVLAAAVVFGVGTGSLSAAPQQTPKAVKGELIAGFVEGVSRAEQNAILKDAATSKKRFGQIDAVQGERGRGGVRRQGALERAASGVRGA